MSGACKRHLNNTCQHGNNIAELTALKKDVKKEAKKGAKQAATKKRASRKADAKADAGAAKAADRKKSGKDKRPVILISNFGMGHAPTELGLKLVQTYLNLLDLDDRLPAAICLYGEGVKLAVEGSPVLEELRSLAGKGVRLVVCTTCLNFFGLADGLLVGTAGSMKDVVDLQWGAKKVITL